MLVTLASLAWSYIIAAKVRLNDDNESETVHGSNRRGGGLAGYGAELRRAGEALRGSMDTADYKHMVPVLILLKFISDGSYAGPLHAQGRRCAVRYGQTIRAGKLNPLQGKPPILWYTFDTSILSNKIL